MSASSSGGAKGPGRVIVLADYAKESAREVAKDLEPWLAARVGEVRLESDIRRFCARVRDDADEREAAQSADLAVVLGGDGAMLGAVRAFKERPVPMVGINVGHVGFLASTPATRWEDTLACVLAGKCELEERMRLAARWRTADGSVHESVALNELCVQRDARQGMLRASVSVNGVWVNDYRADGVLVATPSGSTAYSLSAGGPILEPAVDAFVVTPICSQGLSNRPIVLHGGGKLELSVDASSDAPTIAIDGQAFFPLEPGGTLSLERHPVPYPIYVMPGLDPYRRLRDRLGWGGDTIDRPRG